VSHGELARKIDKEAIDKAFQDPDKAYSNSLKQPWVPTNQVATIVPTYQVKQK
jgi:hypothetical protein